VTWLNWPACTPGIEQRIRQEPLCPGAALPYVRERNRLLSAGTIDRFSLDCLSKEEATVSGYFLHLAGDVRNRAAVVSGEGHKGNDWVIDARPGVERAFNCHGRAASILDAELRAFDAADLTRDGGSTANPRVNVEAGGCGCGKQREPEGQSEQK
jgi:hypothetical protein